MSPTGRIARRPEAAQGGRAQAMPRPMPRRKPAKAAAPRIPGKVMIMSSGDRAWTPATRARRRNPSGPRACSASAGSPRLRPWWRWRRWPARSAAPWRPRAFAFRRRGGECRQPRAGSVGCADRCRHPGAEGRRRSYLQARHEPSSTRPATVSTRSRRRRPSPPPNSPSSAKPWKSSAPRRRSLPPPPPRRPRKEITGSISPPRHAPRLRRRSKWRLPTVEGWVLRDVANGGALIEGRQGIFEVYAGDPVPGLGRIDAIRRQDGHWVVVTSKGLIVAR